MNTRSQYVAPYTGPEFEEGIMRILTADLDAYAWQWINTDMDFCDLDTVRDPGCYVVLDYFNGIPGYEFMLPFSFMVEYFDGILHQVSFIGPDCWYRQFDETTELWSDWTLKIECPIYKNAVAPESPKDGDIWLRIPDGLWYEFILYRYDGESGEWKEIWGKNYLDKGTYDPQGYNMDMFQYFKLSLKDQMGILTKYDCDIIEKIKYSEFYTKVSFMVQVGTHYYFLINPENILAGSNDVSTENFWIIHYNGTEFIEIIQGIGANVRQFVRANDKFFIIRTEANEVHYSRNLRSWTLLEHASTTHEFLERYTHGDLSAYTHEEIESLADQFSSIGRVDFISLTDDNKVHLFTESGSVFLMSTEGIFGIQSESPLPSEFKVFDSVMWKGCFFVAGHMRNGDKTTYYYYSLDEARTWRRGVLPSSKLWTEIYTTEDFILFSTDNAGSEMEKNTVYAIDPYITADTVRVTSSETLTAEYEKFEEAGNIHDIENLTWLPYTIDLGGSCVSDESGILLEFVCDTVPVVQYVESRYESRIRSTYNYLTAYKHEELANYTYEQIKYLASKMVAILEKIVFDEYRYGVIEKSFTAIDNDHYGFVYKRNDEGLGFQTLHFTTYYNDFKSHIKDWDIHMTAEERAYIMNTVTRDKAEELISDYDEEIHAFTDAEVEKLQQAEKIESAHQLMEQLAEHVAKTDIHTTANKIAEWNSKSDFDHTHFLDGRVKITCDDIISGTFAPERLPDEVKKNMVTVLSINDMLRLTKSRVHNGSIVRVLNPATMDLTMYPAGRLFRVMNDKALDSINSYLEFSMRHDRSYVYFDTIQDIPETRDGYELSDVYTRDEVFQLNEAYNKVGYGFEMMTANDIQRDITGLNKVTAGIEFIKENTSNFKADMKSLSHPFIYGEADSSYDVLANVDIGQYLNFQEFWKCNSVHGSTITKIYHIHHLVEIGKFIYSFSNANGVGLAIGLFNETFSIIYTDTFKESNQFVKFIVRYIGDNKLLIVFNGKIIIHNIGTVENMVLPLEYYTQEAIHFEPGDDDYITHMVFVDTDNHLHFTHLKDNGEYDDNVFSHTIAEGYNCTAISYAHGIITVQCNLGNEYMKFRYYNMGRFIHSSDLFELVDRYLGIDGESIPSELSLYEDLPYVESLDELGVLEEVFDFEVPFITVNNDETSTYIGSEFIKVYDMEYSQYYVEFAYYTTNGRISHRIEIGNSAVDRYKYHVIPVCISANKVGVLVFSIGTNTVCWLYTINTHDFTSTKAYRNTIASSVGYMSTSAGYLFITTELGAVIRTNLGAVVSGSGYVDSSDLLYAPPRIYSINGNYNAESKAPLQIADIVATPTVYNELSTGELYHNIMTFKHGSYYKHAQMTGTPNYVVCESNGTIRIVSIADNLTMVTSIPVTFPGDVIALAGAKDVVWVFGHTGTTYMLEALFEEDSTYKGATIFVEDILLNIKYTQFLHIDALCINNVHYCILRYAHNVAVYKLSSGTLELIETSSSNIYGGITISDELISRYNYSSAQHEFALLPGDGLSLSSLTWMESGINSPGQIKTIQHIKITDTERLGICLADCGELYFVSYTCDTSNSVRNIKSVKKVKIDDEFTDMSVINVPDKSGGYHTVIFLIDSSHSIISYSPLWANTALELYLNDRYQLGSHGNSLYDKIDTLIEGMEKSL